MNNLVVLPILVPLLAAVILIFFAKNVIVQRYISALSALIISL